MLVYIHQWSCLFFICFFFFLFSSTAVPTHNRRILHQPFVPLDSSPPSEPPNLSPPAPPTTPKYPFSGSTPPDNTPFFPFFPSPPPPSPASLASFPANISSLIVPEGSKTKPTSSKLIAGAIAAVLAAVIVILIVVFLHIRKRRNTAVSDTKSRRSDNGTPFNYSNAAYSAPGNIPKLQRPSQTSSEFLYLGTLVNSHGGIDNAHNITQQNARSSTADSSAANSRKMDSPELRPLPPLSGLNVRRNHENAEVGSVGDDEDDEFYSPRGSLGGRTSSFGTGSASRRVFAAVEVEKFGGLCSSSSYSSSSTASGSPKRSVSLSISPPVSLSPKGSRPKSPELIAVQTAPLPRPPPPPAPLSFFRNPLVDMKESPSPSLSLSRSPSPPSSTSPDRVSSRSRDSFSRISNVSDQNLESPVQNVPISAQSPSRPPPPPPPPPISVPPPPPPPPPFKHWESPRTPIPQASKIVSEPPVLVTPLRPISLESSPLISPIQLPSNLEPVVENTESEEQLNEDAEKNEETPKPKLKPLHWDKVRASSDREMVWDHLKSSSFKYD